MAPDNRTPPLARGFLRIKYPSLESLPQGEREFVKKKFDNEKP